MFFSTIKEINRLLSKRMSNIYLKVTFEKKWRNQNLDFLSLKSSSRGQVLGAPTHADIIEFLKFLLQIRNQRSGSKTVCSIPIILVLKGIMMF